VGVVIGLLALASACGTSPREAPHAGAARLFQEALDGALSGTESPAVLDGARVGDPRPVSRDYGFPGGAPSAWVVEDADAAKTADLFGSMTPAELRDDFYIVPMVTARGPVCEFDMCLEHGEWELGSVLCDPLPGGQIHDVEDAQARLREHLGEDVEVRTVVFIPSGLVFVVGRSGSSTAAVYLTFADHGAGVEGIAGELPQTGSLYTIDQLKDLIGG
jgi:hypothetical protein